MDRQTDKLTDWWTHSLHRANDMDTGSTFLTKNQRFCLQWSVSREMSELERLSSDTSESWDTLAEKTLRDFLAMASINSAGTNWISLQGHVHGGESKGTILRNRPRGISGFLLRSEVAILLSQGNLDSLVSGKVFTICTAWSSTRLVYSSLQPPHRLLIDELQMFPDILWKTRRKQTFFCFYDAAN